MWIQFENQLQLHHSAGASVCWIPAFGQCPQIETCSKHIVEKSSKFSKESVLFQEMIRYLMRETKAGGSVDKIKFAYNLQPKILEGRRVEHFSRSSAQS